jgi:hypothetical protein
MEGQRLILKDGTRIEDGTAGLADGFLWLYFAGWTMQEAAMMAFNPEKTGTIWFQYGEMEDEFVGYTDCVSIMERGAEISVCLKRGN